MEGERVRQHVEFTIITWALDSESPSRSIPGHVLEYESGWWSFELDGFPPVRGDAEDGERQIAALILQVAR